MRNFIDVCADFGVRGDNTTDDTAAMQAALDALQPGWTLLIPPTPSAIRISAPLEVHERCKIVGPFRTTWPYRYTSPIAGTIKLTAGFTGAAGILIQDNSITGRTEANDGIWIEGLVVDASAAAGNIHCFQVEGLCRDLHFSYCAAMHARGTGDGWNFGTGAGTGAPRGVRMDTCVAYSCANRGFRFNNTTDSSFNGLLATSCTSHGIYISNSGESTFTDCKAVFNAGNGFLIDGTTSVGCTTFLAPGTDRNGQHGIEITQTGTQPIQLIAPRCRRDGSSSTSSNYAGIKITAAGAVPVEIVTPQTVVNDDDGGGGNMSPQWGLRSFGASRVNVIGGELWGVDGGWADAGSNTAMHFSNVRMYSGIEGAKTLQYDAYSARNGVLELQGTTEPEGVVSAAVGSRYTLVSSTTNVLPVEWIKTSGTGNTGWQRLAGSELGGIWAVANGMRFAP